MSAFRQSVMNYAEKSVPMRYVVQIGRQPSRPWPVIFYGNREDEGALIVADSIFDQANELLPEASVAYMRPTFCLAFEFVSPDQRCETTGWHKSVACVKPHVVRMHEDPVFKEGFEPFRKRILKMRVRTQIGIEASEAQFGLFMAKEYPVFRTHRVSAKARHMQAAIVSCCLA